MGADAEAVVEGEVVVAGGAADEAGAEGDGVAEGDGMPGDDWVTGGDGRSDAVADGCPSRAALTATAQPSGNVTTRHGRR
ncbi:hypothetical protein [Streptomyces sp. NBC_00648]|uniref:hypothetical protein n=1 Tax=Streptomyces sp. NBC_00648 TaxID=2975797 RepID=UPI00324C947B